MEETPAVASTTMEETPAAQATLSDSEARLQKQIEFYFSDSNAKDKWLRAAIAKDPEGYLPFADLCKFNRVKELSTDLAVLARVCRQSTHLTVSEDGLKVKRSTPWPRGDTSRPRTVYAKGVPVTATIDAISAHFAATFGAVNAVRVRKGADRQRRRGAFVEFASPDSAAAACAATAVTLGDTPLTIMSAEAYAKKQADKRPKGGPAGGAGKRARNDGEADEGKEVKKEGKGAREPLPAGSVVQFSGIGSGLSRLALREVFNGKMGDTDAVQYIDYTEGQTNGFVRFRDAATATRFVEAAAGLSVDGQTGTFAVLGAGPEWDAYNERWSLFWDLKNSSSQKKVKGKKPQSGKGGKGGGRDKKKRDYK